MPLNESQSKGRVDFTRSLTPAEVDSLVSDPDLEILQSSSEVETSTWDLLNNRLFTARPKVQLRLYGFYSSTCDLSFLSRMPNVHHFSADCLRQSRGIEQLAALRDLESLTIGIYELESFDFLPHLNCKYLKELSLGETRSNKPSLEKIARFEHLRALTIVRQQKGIDVVSRLHQLEDLNLLSITVDSLEFLKNLGRLWSLKMGFGGTRNLSALAGMNDIKYLKLLRIRGLDNISVISAMHGLQYLILEDLPHVDKIPDLSKLPHLRRIVLINLPGLKNISALSTAPALEEFWDGHARRIDMADSLSLIENSKLKKMTVRTGNKPRNQIMDKALNEAGILPYEDCGFTFR